MSKKNAAAYGMILRKIKLNALTLKAQGLNPDLIIKDLSMLSSQQLSKSFLQ